MSKVQVNLYATLRAHVGGASSVDADVRPGQTVEELLRSINVPPDQTRIIFVNNRAAELTHPLQGGERVGVFPAIGGG
jgi:molybdopterin converting factor small subunit